MQLHFSNKLIKSFLLRNPVYSPLFFFVTGIISTEYIELDFKFIIILSFLLVLLTYYKLNFKYLLFIPLGILFSTHSPPDEKDLELLVNNKVDIEGILIKPVERRDQSSRLFLHVNMATVDGKRNNLDVKVMITLNEHLYGIYKGHRIRILGIKLKQFRNYKNPGNFDVENYYKRKQIYLSGFIDDKSDIISFGRASSKISFFELVEKSREGFVRFIRSNLGFPNSEIYSALTIGEKKGIPHEIRNSFSSLGISHLLAISGLHLGAIVLIFYFIFDWLLKRSERLLLNYNVPRITAALTILPIICYMFVSGFATPVIRATIMAVVYLLSIIIGRAHYKLNTLLASAFIILLIDPSAIYDLSFKLSFLSVLGILTIHHYYPLNIYTFKDKLLTSLKTTFIATIFTLPIIINSFGIVSLLSVPANLIFIPLVEFIIVPLGLISYILFHISSSATVYLIEANNHLINLLLSLVQSLSSLNIASVTVPYLNNLSVTLYYLSVFLIFAFISTGSKWLKLLTPAVIFLFLFSASFGFFKDITNKNFEAYFLDSGTRNTVFIRTQSGKHILINGGISRFNQNGFTEKSVITPFLLKTGISKIDHIILTQTNEDILEGTSHLISKFNTDYLWTNGARLNSKVWEEIKSANLKWINLQTGYEPLHLGKTNITMQFSPNNGTQLSGDNSVSINIKNENLRLLITDASVYKQSIKIFNDKNPDDQIKKIIYLPYMNNDYAAIDYIQTYKPDVLITKKDKIVNESYKFKKYQTSKDGMIKVVLKNKSLKILPHNR